MSIGYPPDAIRLPTHLDLPHTDDKPAENVYQPEQSAMLTAALMPHLDRLHPDDNYFIGQDCGIYWENTKLPLDGCKCPDWYYVPNVPRMLDGTWRRSYVMWNEIATPLLLAEWVSGNGDEERDITEKTGKFWVYERGIRSVYYLIYDPYREHLEVFELIRGRYQSMLPNAEGRIRIPAMELEFGIWRGLYHGLYAPWIRAWDDNGVLIPTAEETRTRAETALQQAVKERIRAEAALQAVEECSRAARMAARLRELGIDPDAV